MSRDNQDSEQTACAQTAQDPQDLLCRAISDHDFPRFEAILAEHPEAATEFTFVRSLATNDPRMPLRLAASLSNPSRLEGIRVCMAAAFVTDEMLRAVCETVDFSDPDGETTAFSIIRRGFGEAPCIAARLCSTKGPANELLTKTLDNGPQNHALAGAENCDDATDRQALFEAAQGRANVLLIPKALIALAQRAQPETLTEAEQLSRKFGALGFLATIEPVLSSKRAQRDISAALVPSPHKPKAGL